MLIYLPLCVFLQTLQSADSAVRATTRFFNPISHCYYIMPRSVCVPVCPFGLCQVPLGLCKAALGLCKAGMGLWKAVHFGKLLWACGWHSASADVLSALQMHTGV